MDDINSLNKKIGDLVLEMINDIEDRTRNSAEKRDKKIHYLERLTQELSTGRKKAQELIKTIFEHPLIRQSVSQESLSELLLAMIQNDMRCAELHTMNPQSLGEYIVNNILNGVSSVLVIFPLHGLLLGHDIKKLGTTNFDTLANILLYHQIQPMKAPTETGQQQNYVKFRIKEAYKFERDYQQIYCACTIVSAYDNIAAVRKAEQHLNIILNIFRILVPLCCTLYNRQRFSIHDSSIIDTAFIISLPSHERILYSKFITTPFAFIPPLQQELDKPIYAAIKIADKKDSEKSDAEKRVISAINWAGEGIDAIETDIKVVKCVIALEVLFQLKTEKKQQQFVEVVKQFFNCQNIDSKRIEDHAKEIYKLRSAIVHEGKHDISEEEAEWAERIACGCILRTLEKMAINNNYGRS